MLLDEVLKMAGPYDPVELSRAKNALKSGVFMHLEQRAMLLDDMGSQVKCARRRALLCGHSALWFAGFLLALFTHPRAGHDDG